MPSGSFLTHLLQAALWSHFSSYISCFQFQLPSSFLLLSSHLCHFVSGRSENTSCCELSEAHAVRQRALHECVWAAGMKFVPPSAPVCLIFRSLCCVRKGEATGWRWDVFNALINVTVPGASSLMWNRHFESVAHAVRKRLMCWWRNSILRGFANYGAYICLHTPLSCQEKIKMKWNLNFKEIKTFLGGDPRNLVKLRYSTDHKWYNSLNVLSKFLTIATTSIKLLICTLTVTWVASWTREEMRVVCGTVRAFVVIPSLFGDRLAHS